MTATLDYATRKTRHAGPFVALMARLDLLLDQSWFYYGTLLILQLKRIWGMWQYLDLTSGDTSFYFADAYKWFRYGQTDIAWSPMYHIFYGSLLHLTSDVATVTVLHRILIVLFATMLVLAVLRRMLPAEIAWLIGAWWAIMPINFETTYEVHLFALLPILVAWLVILSFRGPWARGSTLGILLLEAFLVRNEMMVGAGCFALVCLGWEVHRFRARRIASTPRLVGTTFAGYLVPVAIAMGCVAWTYHRSYIKYPLLTEILKSKHTVNMGQVYAFGYEQRHPEWTDSPWVEYQRLCIRDFGTDAPTFGLMVRRNPRAMASHFLWNISLVPNGLQLMLFSASSGTRDPGYNGADLNRRYPIPLSIVTFCIVLVGGTLLWRDRERWWRDWIRDRLLGWLAMFSVGVVSVFIILSQRPRPSYLFSLTVLLMTLIGMCVFAILVAIPQSRRLRFLMPALMVVLMLEVPSAYGGNRHPPVPLTEVYERLRPYASLIADPKCVFLEGDFPQDIMNYIGISEGRALDYSALATLKPGLSLADLLDSKDVNLAYIDRSLWMQLDSRSPGVVEQFLATGQKSGWELVGYGDLPVSQRWLLCRRTMPRADQPSLGVLKSMPWLESFAGWSAVSGMADMEGPYPENQMPVVRWGLGPESRIAVNTDKSGKYTLLISGLSPVDGQILTLLLDGRQLGRYPMKVGVFDDLAVPLQLEQGHHELVIQYTTWQDATPTIKEACLYKRLLIRPAE